MINIDSFNHYHLVRNGDDIEVYQYNDTCPKMGVADTYKGKQLIGCLPKDGVVLWRIARGRKKIRTKVSRLVKPRKLDGDEEFSVDLVGEIW